MMISYRLVVVDVCLFDNIGTWERYKTFYSNWSLVDQRGGINWL